MYYAIKEVNDSTRGAGLAFYIGHEPRELSMSRTIYLSGMPPERIAETVAGWYYQVFTHGMTPAVPPQ